MKKYYLAVDIGASSGRHIVAHTENGILKTDEVYRFKNGVCEQSGHLIWDIEALWQSVLEGTKKAFEKYPSIASMAIDTWAVDYVLLKNGKELLPVYAYRDKRTEEIIDRVHSIIPQNELYAKTGIQFQPFNTIYQLYADKLSGRLDGADDFLMIPEYLSYKLTGVICHEYTNATTTGMLDPTTMDYDTDIIERLGLPKHLFKSPKAPSTYLGELLPEISEYVGGQLKVLLCASHDTASAVEGIPMTEDAPYISSGTWSLLGTKIKEAITTPESLKANYTNEGGVGYIRYLKNIMGMWVINNLKAELSPSKSFDEIMQMAMKSSFEGIVDLTDNSFLAPKSMTEAFASAFKESNAPKSDADYFKCAHLSLAHCYKNTLSQLCRLTGRKYDKLYIVGGGAKNTYLNTLTEQVCSIKVVALPIEATAIGNLKIQMEADK